jgi:hypothetical protein
MCRIGQTATHLGYQNERYPGRPARRRRTTAHVASQRRKRRTVHTPSLAQIDAAQSLVWQRWRSLL